MTETTTSAPTATDVRMTRDGAVVTFSDGYPFKFVGGPRQTAEAYAADATAHRAEARASVALGRYYLAQGYDGWGQITAPDTERYDNRDDAEVAAHRRTLATGIDTWSSFGEPEQYNEPWGL